MFESRPSKTAVAIRTGERGEDASLSIATLPQAAPQGAGSGPVVHGAVGLAGRRVFVPGAARLVAGNAPLWRDDPERVHAHIQADRKRHYLMLPLMIRRFQQEELKRRAVRRYGAAFSELQGAKAEAQIG